jgi:hypothetical protein
MGAYDSPDVNVGIDRDSGRMIGQGIASIGKNIAAGVGEKRRLDDIAAERKRQEAERERIRAEQNWKIHKAVESEKTQETLDFNATLKTNNIDMASLDSSFKGIIDTMYSAKDRLAQSRGDYDGRVNDESTIRNSKAFIAEIGENFATMNTLTSTWKERFKKRDQPGGIDNSSTDPLFAAMMNIGEGSGEGANAGTVGWESRVGPGGKIQLFQVADSPTIRELNDGKAYELSYDQVRGYFDDDDNNPNTFGPFSLVPDYTAEIKADAQAVSVFGEDGQLTQPDENGVGGVYSKGKEFEVTDGQGIYMDQKTWPDTKLIRSKIAPKAKAAAQSELELGASSITANSNIRSNARSREVTIDGQKATQYYFNYGGERDGEGEIIGGEEIVLGDSVTGLMSQGNEEGTEETSGYNPDEYSNYLRFTENLYMGKVGAYAPPYSVTPEKRDYITQASGNTQEVAASYVTTALDNPAATYTGIIGDNTAVYDAETGMLKTEDGDDTYDFSKNESGEYNKPEQVKRYLTDLLKNDITFGNTKEDRVLKKQILDQLDDLEAEVSEEEVIESNLTEITAKEITEYAPQFSLISEELSGIVSKNETIGGGSKLKMVNALVDQSVEAFKRKGKKVSREIIINSLIDDEENKRATGESSKPGFLKGMQGGFDTLKVLKQILRGPSINPFTGEPYS